MEKHVSALSISDLKKWLEETEEDFIKQKLPSLQADPRKGVQMLVKQWVNQQLKKEQEELRWAEMSHIEASLRQTGYRLLCGVDEAGRGPLAGPVVSAAVILPENAFVPGLNDSKQLTRAKREEFAQKIKEIALAYSVSFIKPEEIDRLNIYQATKQGMVESIQNLALVPDYVLIDAMQLPLIIPYQAIIKGDSKSISIAAASVLAKVARDKYMQHLAEEYPQYGFEKHMGYPTKEHIEVIKKWGVTPHHRRSFLQNILLEEELTLS